MLLGRKVRFHGGRGVALVLVGLIVGTLFLTPAGAHVGGTVRHLWNKHLKSRADARYVQRMFAVVDDDGTLVNGRRVVSSRRDATGNYTVTFKRDISDCAVVTSTGGYPLTESSNTGVSVGTAQATVLGTEGTLSREVAVITRDLDPDFGTDIDRIFHVIVAC